MSNEKNRPVPTGRVERLFGFGAMAGAVGARMAFSGARQLLSGKPPSLTDLLLAPANALKVADQLSHMRGAAMKLGQLLSMDAGQILPEDWSAILARLQSDASSMPAYQLERQLVAQWGRNWRERFETFSIAPIAAASIGQVHRARTRDGRDLAIKVQYPGVAASIDSDIDNLVSLIKLSRMMPADFAIGPLVAEARRQLHEEADYLNEAEQIRRYGRLVHNDPDLLVPEVDDSLTGRSVIAMSFIDSVPIDWIVDRPQAERNRVAERLIRLTLQEVFVFGLIQTDPNFANFRYQPGTGRIVLLDFGATRAIPPELTARLRVLLQAALARDTAGQRAAMLEIGYFKPGQDRLGAMAIELLNLGMDAVETAPMFDFHEADLPRQARDWAMTMGYGADVWSVPPIDTMFVHRKIGGMYLLAAKLRAQVDMGALLRGYAGQTD